MTYARIQASLSAIDVDAKALSDQVAALTAQVAQLTASLSQATADASAKASEIAALKNEIAALNAEIATLKARIAELTATTVTPPARGQSLFSTQVPASQNVTDGSGTAGDYELGMRFTVAASGVIQAIRYWKASSETGSHTGKIWNASTGEQLASVIFANETASGWQEQALAAPLAVTAGVTYVVSVNATRYYVVTAAAFSAPLVANGITAPVAAGVYNSTPGQLPATVWNNSNYFRDVVFLQTGAVTPTPTPTPTPSLLNLPRVQWHGGPSYYAQFPKAASSGWTNPSFFPIAVFFGKPAHAATLKAAGINTYMGAEHDGSSMSSITNAGMFVLAQPEWTAGEVGNDIRVVGWHVADEPDMTSTLADQTAAVKALRSRNDGRFLQTNYGNGVLGTWWDTASNPMSGHVAMQDVTSVDKYAYTSPAVRFEFGRSPYWTLGENGAACSFAYGWQQDRMNGYMMPAASKPNWVFVEVAKPYLTEAGATTIGLEQMEGAVWNAIIHGASGIAYFQHNNDATNGAYAIVDGTADRKAKVAAINAQITRMAPVLNTQSYAWTFGPGLDTALKVYSGYAYILAMPAANTSGSRTFTLPAGVNGTQVEVVEESRTLPISGGKFTDSFAAEHEHHIYRISLA